jgi:hypothetical protein
LSCLGDHLLSSFNLIFGEQKSEASVGENGRASLAVNYEPIVYRQANSTSGAQEIAGGLVFKIYFGVWKAI